MAVFRKEIKGIYLIERLDIEKEKNTPIYYIGLAVDIFDRLNQHCNGNEQYIDKTIQDIGCLNFSFKILEVVSNADELKSCETKWINFYKQEYGEKRMFNISETTNTNPHKIDSEVKKKIKKLFEEEIGRSIYAITEKYEVRFEEVIKIRKPLLNKHNLTYDNGVKNIVDKATRTKPQNWKGDRMTKTLAEKILSLKEQNKSNRDIANECNLSITDVDIFYHSYTADQYNYDFADEIKTNCKSTYTQVRFRAS